MAHASTLEAERPKYEQAAEEEEDETDECEENTSDWVDEDEVSQDLSSCPTRDRIKRGAESARCYWFWQYQPLVYDVYKSDWVQYFVAFLIVLNFFVQCMQREIIPEHERQDRQDTDGDHGDKSTNDMFDMFSYIFNWIFLIELLVNMYGNWFFPFIEVGWNKFDVVVVTLGVIDMLPIQLPGPLKMVRMLRAFRIFRLFGRVESLRKILESLQKAAAGVANALIILLILICIYSVLAVDLYKDIYCGESTVNTTHAPGSVKETTRGLCFGYDYYGDFLKSFYTMFQILTGESWSEAAVRPILHYYSGSDPPDWWAYVASMLFFVSFILINSFVLLNVFVAVLLDGMNNVDDTQVPDSKDSRFAEEEEGDDGSCGSQKGLLVPALKEGQNVIALRNFQGANSKNPKTLVTAGQKGSVLHLDEVGDALVKFEGLPVKHQWVVKRNFRNLRVDEPHEREVTEEDILEFKKEMLAKAASLSNAIDKAAAKLGC